MLRTLNRIWNEKIKWSRHLKKKKECGKLAELFKQNRKQLEGHSEKDYNEKIFSNRIR